MQQDIAHSFVVHTNNNVPKYNVSSKTSCGRYQSSLGCKTISRNLPKHKVNQENRNYQKNVNIHKDHMCKENLLINGSMNTKFQNNTCKIRAPFRTLS